MTIIDFTIFVVHAALQAAALTFYGLVLFVFAGLLAWAFRIMADAFKEDE